MGAEFEIKYRSSREKLEQIAGSFGDHFAATQMQTTYFDTPDKGISRRRWMLRVRKENEKEFCTLKTPGANGVRGEWEVPCGKIHHAIEELCELEELAELKSVVGDGLVVSCGAQFVRRSITITEKEFTAELALDQGVLFGKKGEIPFEEVELELKSGSREAMEQYAAEFAGRFGLQPEPLSKFARALTLRQEE